MCVVYPASVVCCKWVNEEVAYYLLVCIVAVYLPNAGCPVSATEGYHVISYDSVTEPFNLIESS